MLERTTITRHCASKDMYDDGGYCETKIRRLGVYYWAGVADGNGENMCSDCMLQALLYQLQETNKIPEYTDRWMEDFKLITGRKE